jgi:hypothetical protein
MSRAVHDELRRPELRGAAALTGADDGIMARTKCEGFEPFYRCASRECNVERKGTGRLGRCCARLVGSVSTGGARMRTSGAMERACKRGFTTD